MCPEGGEGTCEGYAKGASPLIIDGQIVPIFYNSFEPGSV